VKVLSEFGNQVNVYSKAGAPNEARDKTLFTLLVLQMEQRGSCRAEYPGPKMR
jgi:hypothetical protein